MKPRGSLLDDITAGEGPAEALELSIKRFRDIAENALEWIWEVDTSGKYIYTSPMVEKILGYRPDEILEKHFYDLFHPDDREELKAAAFEAFAKKQPFRQFINRNIHKNGKTVWLSTSGVPVLDEAGDLLGYRGADIDITEQKQTEEEIARLAKFPGENPNPIMRVTQDGTILYANKAASPLLKEWKCQVGQPLPEYWRKFVSGVLHSGKRKDVEIDVGQQTISVTFAPIAGKDYINLYGLDITERKQAEEELQAEKNKLQSLIDAMEDGLNIMDKDYNIIYQNWPLRRLYGDRTGEKCYRVYEDREEICDGCPVEKAFKDGKSHTSERKIVAPSGEIAFWENTANPIRDARGNIVSCLEITRNITEHKKTDEELWESEERYRAVIEGAHDMIQSVTLDGHFLFVNRAWLDTMGYTEAELPELNLFKIIHPDSLPHCQEMFARVMKGEAVDNVQATFVAKDGRSVLVEGNAAGYYVGGKLYATQGIFRDITERKKIEEELQESQRFSSSLLQNAPNSILVLEPDASVRYVNPAFEKLTGFALEEILGVGMPHPWWPEEYSEEMTAALKKAMARGGRRTERIFQKKSGERFWVAMNSIGVKRKGKPLYFLLNMLDITESKRMQEELRDSQEKLERMFESVTDGILVVNLDGTILKVNEKAAQMHGFASEEEMIGKNALEISTPRDHKKIIKNMRRVIKEGTVSGIEYTLLKSDGSEFPAELSTSALKDASGKVIGHITITRDITRRKQMLQALRESEEKFSKAFHSSPDAIAITRLKDGLVMEINDNFCTITGYSREEVINHTTNDFGLWVRPEDRERMVKIFREEGRVHNEEFEFRMKSGEVRIWLFSSEIIDIGGERCLISMTIDITERKRAEEALKQKMEELRVAYKKLKELDQLKDSFLSTVSHELRTPLTSIKSFSEILLTYDEDKETQHEFLNIIKEESDRLTRLINDFLDLSKIEAGRMQWETVELSISEVIKTAINATRALAAQTNLKVNTEVSSDLPTVQCDKDRLVQVVTNLLSNAIKFTPEGGMIQVKAQTLNGGKSKKASDMVMVSVSDTGIGIAPKDYKNVFEKFKQVGDTLTDKPKGTGLGLPICKEIIEHYGGKIWVESELGKGSTFFFSLPAVQVAEAEAPEAEVEEVEVAIKGDKIILVVDDEANIRRFLTHELKKRGYRVLQASGATEAIELVRKHRPDLITLDVLMGGMSGFDVTAVLKNDPETKDIPILIVSVVEDRKRAYKLGVNDYLTKPFKIELLIDKVNQLLRDAQKKILVVDDDKNLVKSLKYQLGKRGYSTYVAHNGKRALEKIESQPPDLILLDIMMPEMDGYEVMKALKQKPKTAQIPIVVMTGVEIDGSRVKALSVGAAEYFTKSGGFGKMFDTIETILGSKSDA